MLFLCFLIYVSPAIFGSFFRISFITNSAVYRLRQQKYTTVITECIVLKGVSLSHHSTGTDRQIWYDERKTFTYSALISGVYLVQQDFINPDAGYPDRQLFGSSSIFG
jgi:hypothetical protein